MLNVLNHLIQAVEKLVIHNSTGPSGLVPTLIQQAQDSLQRAKDAWAAETAPVPTPEPLPEPPASLPPAAPAVAEAPAADPAPEAAASDQTADALNAAEEQGLEQVAPTTAVQPEAS